MKSARFLTPLLAALLFGGPWSHADTSIFNTGFDPNNPEPNLVPRQETAPPRLTDQDRAALKEKQKRDEASRNWLAHGYQDELEKRDKAAAKEDEKTLYSELSSSPYLARLAGFTPDEVSDLNGKPDLHASTDHAKTAVSIRPDGLAPGQARSFFRPFLSTDPLPASRPLAAPSPLSARLTGSLTRQSDPLSGSSSFSSLPSDPTMMDVPGLTAAQSSPSTRDSMGLGTADDIFLNPESGSNKPSHDLDMDLPVARDSERLQKEHENSLDLPGPLSLVKKPAATTKLAPVIPPESATEQMVPEPPPPIGKHIADPFDILR